LATASHHEYKEIEQKKKNIRINEAKKKNEETRAGI